MAELTAQEKLVAQYIQDDNKESAIKLLLKLITNSANEKDFLKAEALRKKLIEVDDMALSEIVQSAEIIEDAKSKSLDKNHMVLWSKLYDQLSTQEGNALFYSMKEVVYNAEEVIFKQGERNPELYFIDSGELKLVYDEDNQEKLLDTLRTGDITGTETFFSISFSTSSLITLTDAKLKVLNRDALKSWQEDLPGLESKLAAFCNSLKKMEDLAKNGRDRRRARRFDVSGIVQAQLLNSAGVLTGNPFRGNLSDISSGGVAFSLKIPKAKTAKHLLGKSLFIKITLTDGNTERIIKQKGAIVRVTNRILSEYLIHLKFDQKLAAKAITDVAFYSEAEMMELNISQ